MLTSRLRTLSDDADYGDIPISRLNPDVNPLARVNTPMQPNPGIQPVNKLQSLASDTPMQDMYQNFIKQGPPQAQPPSPLTRLAAGLGGFSGGVRNPMLGVQTAQTILDRPFDRSLLQYDRRAKELQGAAGEEEKNITNKRLAENEFQKLLVSQGRAANQDELDKARAAYYGARTIALAHPNWKAAKANGKVILYDPAKPENKVELGDANIISPEAMNQQINKFRTENGIRVKGQEDVEGVRQRNRRSNLEFTEAGKDRRAAERNNKTKMPSASQQRTAHSQALQEVLGDPKNAGAFKDVVNGPTKETPYYTLKDVNQIAPEHLAQLEVLLGQVKGRRNQILGINEPGDINLGKGNNPAFSIEEDNDEEDDNDSDDK